MFVVDNDRAAVVYDLDSVEIARYAIGMNTPWRLFLAPLGLALVGTIGCSSARGYCEAGADCDPDFFENFTLIDPAGDADDSVAVCVATQDRFVASYRANEEEKCQRVADAIEAYQACIGAAFADNDDGCEVLQEDCEDERDDFNDAFGDTLDGDCSSEEE